MLFHVPIFVHLAVKTFLNESLSGHELYQIPIDTESVVCKNVKL